MWNVHIPNSYMENTFGCWSGNVPPVHSTACDWHFRASPLAVMLCHCWQWLHYYSKPEDASGFELLIQLLSKEGKKVVFFSAAKFCCVFLYCSASVLWFSLVFLPGCDTFLNCVSTDSLFAILLIQQSCGCFATVLVLLLERLVERGKKLISCTNSQVRTFYEQRQKMEMQQSVQGANRCITPTGELKSLQRNLTWTL